MRRTHAGQSTSDSQDAGAFPSSSSSLSSSSRFLSRSARLAPATGAAAAVSAAPPEERARSPRAPFFPPFEQAYLRPQRADKSKSGFVSSVLVETRPAAAVDRKGPLPWGSQGGLENEYRRCGAGQPVMFHGTQALAVLLWTSPDRVSDETTGVLPFF